VAPRGGEHHLLLLLLIHHYYRRYTLCVRQQKKIAFREAFVQQQKKTWEYLEMQRLIALVPLLHEHTPKEPIIRPLLTKRQWEKEAMIWRNDMRDFVRKYSFLFSLASEMV